MSEPQCNPHPKAPHGFNRNSSHSAGRYVCDCEHWEPYDAGYQKGLQDGLERAYALQEISDIGQPQEAPPRREPLTEEQIADIAINGKRPAPHDCCEILLTGPGVDYKKFRSGGEYGWVTLEDLILFIRAIEQAHGIGEKT